MTREEAIEYFKQHIDLYCVQGICREAEEMAIKALEQEPCEDCCNGNQEEKAKLCQKSYLAGMEHRQEPCEDAVSREAVEDAVIWNDEKREMLDEIQKLPSVQPKQKTGTWKKDIDNSRRWDRVRFYCSECGSWQTYGETDFCPSCGARMIKPQEE